MEYTVIKHDSIEALIEVVNEYIQDGWKPLGGVAISTSVGSGSYSQSEYAQAMTKV
jgi:hypothetical protein